MTHRDPTLTVNAGAFDDVPELHLLAAMSTTLAGEGHPGGELSLTLLDDEGIRELNRAYLGKDSITDVLAFSLGDEGVVLGDVYVGVPQARRQAQEYGVPVAEELLRLAIHGTLHVLGHDHPEGPERTESPMFALQEAYLKQVLSGLAEAGS